MKSESKHHIIAGGLFLNLCCSVCIVFLNKWLYSITKFPNITLTCIHFIATSIGLFICQMLNVFSPKTISFRDIFPLSVTFCGFVVFTNLSLQSNTVGTYQLAKVLTTPAIIFIQSQFYDQTFSSGIKLTLIPIIIGVIMNSYYDIRFNIEGTIYALVGVGVTSMYQILVGSKQKELQANSMQLLYYQAPLSALLLMVVIPLFEPIVGTGGIFSGQWTNDVIGLVFLSACVAFLINLTIFWIIGNTSPVTYNMFGHFKFSITLLGGFLIFEDPIQFNQFLGIIVTLGGIITYTHLKMKENKTPPTNPGLSTLTVKP